MSFNRCDRLICHELSGVPVMIVRGSLVFLLFGLFAAEAPGEDRLRLEVAALTLPRIERGDSVGIVVGVVRDGRSEVFGFGRPSFEDDEPPDGRTIFEIGSI